MTSMNRHAEVLRLAQASAAARSRHGGAAVGGFPGGAGVGGCGWQPNVWDSSYGFQVGPSGFGPGYGPIGQANGPSAQLSPQSAAQQAMVAMANQQAGGGVGANFDTLGGLVPGANVFPYGISPMGPYQGAWGPNALCGLYAQARGVQCVELGFALPGTLGPGLSVTFTINPSIPVQPIRIRFPSAFAPQIQVNSATVGTEQLLLGAGIPAQLGTEVSIQGIPLARTTVLPGQGLVISLTNVSGAALPTVAGQAIGSLTVEAMFC